MSEEQDQMDYEALNARTALDLNKAQQEIERLRAVLHDIISGKADGCPDCARHEMVALAALETDDE